MRRSLSGDYEVFLDDQIWEARFESLVSVHEGPEWSRRAGEASGRIPLLVARGIDLQHLEVGEAVEKVLDVA